MGRDPTECAGCGAEGQAGVCGGAGGYDGAGAWAAA